LEEPGGDDEEGEKREKREERQKQRESARTRERERERARARKRERYEVAYSYSKREKVKRRGRVEKEKKRKTLNGFVSYIEKFFCTALFTSVLLTIIYFNNSTVILSYRSKFGTLKIAEYRKVLVFFKMSTVFRLSPEKFYLCPSISVPLNYNSSK
jgi:hypothetical protein